MTDIAPIRINIQVEETEVNASVSEATLQRVGAAANFINERHFERKTWALNAAHSNFNVQGLDGVFVVPFDMEILYFSMGNVVSGSSGTTEADIQRFTTPSGAGTSIFSTTPKIDSTSGNNTYMLKDILTPANDVSPTGIILPVFSTTDLNQGDMLRADILDSMTSAKQLSFTIHYRPR